MTTLADKIKALQNGNPAATVQPVATQPAVTQPAVTQPVAAVNSIAAAVTQPAAAVNSIAATLNGGNRLTNVIDALKTATVGNRRNDLPLGSGHFLLKSGKFIVTEGDKFKITSFSMVCLQGTVDGAGIIFGSQGYAGPLPGSTYQVSIFHDLSPKYVKGTMSTNLSVLQACVGWTAEQVKQHQTTDDGVLILLDLLKGLMCVSMDNLTPTNEACLFSNQVVVQLTTKQSIKEQKVDGKSTYDENQQKITKTYINTFWDKKIPLSEVGAYGDDLLVSAFGSQELFVKAYEIEQAMLAG